jgi:hypothetical protein
MATLFRKCSCCGGFVGITVSVQVLACAGRGSHHQYSVLVSPSSTNDPDIDLSLSCFVSVRRGLVLARRGLVLARVRPRAGSSSRGFVLVLSKNDVQEAQTRGDDAALAASAAAPAAATAAEAAAAEATAAEAAAAEAKADAAAATTEAADTQAAEPETKRQKVAELFVPYYASHVVYTFALRTNMNEREVDQ